MQEIEEVVHVKTEPGEITSRAQIPITQQKQTEIYVPVVEEPDVGAVALDESYGDSGHMKTTLWFLCIEIIPPRPQ